MIYSYVHYCDDETVDRIRAAGLLVRVGDSPDSGQRLRVCTVRQEDFAVAAAMRSPAGSNAMIDYAIRDARRAVARMSGRKGDE